MHIYIYIYGIHTTWYTPQLGMGLPGWAGWSCCFLQASWLFKPKVAVQACCLCKHAVWKANSRLASGTWSSWSGLRVSWQKQSRRRWRVCVFSSCYKVVSPVEWINNHVRSETPHLCDVDLQPASGWWRLFVQWVRMARWWLRGSTLLCPSWVLGPTQDGISLLTYQL